MLTAAQIMAILSLLMAFGAEPTTIKQVEVALQPKVVVEVIPTQVATQAAPKVVKKDFTGDPKKLCTPPMLGYQWGKDTGDKCKVWLEQ